jgi:LEA14-like dessication related protein
MRQRTPAVAVLLAVAALAGCASKQKVAAQPSPKLVFVSHEIESAGFQSTALVFDCVLQNPLSTPVALSGARWALDVEGTRVAEGELPGGMEVAPGASAPVRVAAPVRFSMVPKFGLAMAKNGEARYHLAMTASVATAAGPVDAPLVHDSTFRGPRMPKFSIDGIKVRSMSLKDTALDVRLAVENENDFAIPTGELGFELVLGGNRVAGAKATPLGELAPRSKGVIAVPLELSVFGAGKAAFDAIRRGKFDAGVKGTATYAGLPVPVDVQQTVDAER